MKDKFYDNKSLNYDNNHLLYNLVKYNLVVKEEKDFNYFCDSKNLIESFINDDYMYQRLVELITCNNYANIKIYYYDGELIKSTNPISLVDIVTFCQNNLIKMNEKTKYINSIVGMEYLKQTLTYSRYKYKNKIYRSNDLLDMLTMDENEFNSLDEEAKNALVNFVNSKNIFKLVYISDEYKDRFNDLKDSLKISDVNDSNVSLVDDVIIDSKLDELLNDSNILTLSNLDKALYIYYQMCYYLNYKNDNIIELDKLDNVTLYSEVNEIEFALIYAYYLKVLGIDYMIDYNNSNIITFEYGEYELAINKNNIKVSMNNVKNGLPVVGLNSTNYSETIRNKFYEHYYKILLDSQMQKADRIEFLDNLNNYESKCEKVEMPIKIYTFLKNVARHKVLKDDNIDYIKKLYNILLSKHENNIKLYIDETDEFNLIITINDLCYVINANNLNNIKKINLSEINEYIEENGLSDEYGSGIKR